MMVPMEMGDTFSRNFRKMNHSLKDRLIRHMEDGRYEPQSKSELARALNVDSRQKLDFRALVDQMEERGYVGPFEGSKPRQLLIDKAKWQELKMAKAPAPEPEIDRNGSIRDVFESRDALD